MVGAGVAFFFDVISIDFDVPEKEAPFVVVLAGFVPEGPALR